MRLPDFLVVGAQKSGTTSLFAILRKHPQLFLPARKEIQFFSSPMLFRKGIDWYANEFFATCPPGHLAGEVSPQYMYSTEVAKRVHDGLPDAKIIAILRDPIDRAWSHYLMSCRRELETRSPEEAFALALEVDEADRTAPETFRYFQFGNYERVLNTYLELYGRDRLLVLFQEDLAENPEEVFLEICRFLGIGEKVPENIDIKTHQSGSVRFRAIARLTREDSLLRRCLRRLVPGRLRPTIVFWAEVLNIRPLDRAIEMPETLRQKYAEFSQRQALFLKREFGLTPPWPSLTEPKKTRPSSK